MPFSDSLESWRRLRVAVFVAALFLPLAVMSSPFLRSWTDSRAAAFPDWSWRVGNLKRYPSRFEEQFNAAMPARARIAGWSRAFHLDWLGVSPVPEVILGRDGWLYYTGPVGDKVLDRHLRGRDPFSAEDLRLLREALLERARHFRSLGARYVLVVAPNKESVYPEHLPGWVGPKVGPSRLDQLMADLQSVPAITAIDLRPGVLADKGAAQLYHKADTHWNARGAYAAWREIMRVLETGFPGLATRSWADLEPRAVLRSDLDIARMLGLDSTPPEADFDLPRGPCGERRPIPVPIPDALRAKLTAPAYATQCHAPGGVDAVIFHDSFGVALLPFFARSFRSTANFSATAGRGDLVGYGMPEKLKANLVLEIIVERSLGAVPQF